MNSVEPYYVSFVVAPYFTKVMPHLGIGYLRASVESKGFRTDYHDFSAIDREDKMVRSLHYFLNITTGNTVYSSMESFFEWFEGKGLKRTLGPAMSAVFQDKIEEYSCNILASDPNMVAFSIYDTNLVFSVAIAEQIKKQDPSVKIVFGGPFLVDPDIIRILFEIGETIDYMIVGEAEKTLAELVLSISEGRTDIPETCIKAGETINTHGIKGNVIQSLDDLPFPVFRDAPFGAYKNNMRISSSCMNMFVTGEKVLPIIFGRGCPYNCSFCGHNSYWKKYRLRTVESVLKEFTFMKEELDCRVFRVNDSLMNMDRKWLMELCEGILDLELDIYWYGHARSAGIDDELARVIHRAGCRYMKLGLESGSDRMLKLMNKKSTVRQHREGLIAAHNAGIKTRASFIYGFPGETEKDFNHTLEFVLDCKDYLDSVKFGQFFIVPGSDVALNPDKYEVELSGFNVSNGNKSMKEYASRIPLKWNTPLLGEEVLKERLLHLNEKLGELNGSIKGLVSPPNFPELIKESINKNDKLKASVSAEIADTVSERFGVELNDADRKVLESAREAFRISNLKIGYSADQLNIIIFKLMSLGLIKIVEE